MRRMPYRSVGGGDVTQVSAVAGQTERLPRVTQCDGRRRPASSDTAPVTASLP